MMKVLIVASGNSSNFSFERHQPFIHEQLQSIKKIDCTILFKVFLIQKNGIRGYLSYRKKLIDEIRSYNPDLIHAHYGLSGLLANLQRKVPVITTYHGSDIHSKGFLLQLSKICMNLSAFNIFVNQRLYEISGYKKNNYVIQPCGTDLSNFYILSRFDARQSLGWKQDERYVLFAGAFENQVKNSSLAKNAVSFLKKCHLIELKGYDRPEVNVLMNACDCLLMTSDREASPMVIKEAMLCGCPIVSVDVGDVKEVIAETKGCFMVDRNPELIASTLWQAFDFEGKTDGRDRIIQLGLELSVVARRIQAIYKEVGKTRNQD